MNTSPVEGAKYLAYAGKEKSSSKLHRKLTPFNLAKINIQRNKQKAILTLLMLGVSGALLLVTSTVAGSIDPEKQASFKYYPAGNILVQIRNTVGSSFNNESEPYGSAKLQLEENPLEDQALIQELEKIDGIEKITAFDCVYMTVSFSGGSGSITSISDFFPTLNREQTEEKQAVLSSGTADYDDMVERNGILVAEDIAQIGDTLKIEGRASDGSTFDMEAVVVGTYNRSDLMENSPVVPGSPYFIMTYDTAKKLTGITEQTGILAVKNSDGRFDEVLTAVQEIADRNGKIEVNTIEQTIIILFFQIVPPTVGRLLIQMQPMPSGDVKQDRPADRIKGLLAVVVPAFGLLRVGERDAQFFQRLFLLGAQFPVAVLTVKDVPLMDVGRPLVQMERPVQDVDMGTEAALKFLIKLIDDGKERIRRDGFSHRADLVDTFLRAGLVVFQQVLHGAVALGVPGFLIPGVLGLHMAAVMLVVVHPLDFLKAEIRLLRVLPELVCGEAPVAIPVDVLSGPLGVNVFAVLHIEPAVIVAGIIGAMLAGASIVSCQFQTDFLLPAKMFRGRGRAAKPQILRKSASGNTQYELTQASTLPGQGVSPLTRWGGCPQPAKALRP